MSRGASPARRGLGLVMTAWSLASCRPSVATEPPPSPPAPPPPASIAAAPTPSEPASPAQRDEPQRACAPASEPFDERAILAEIDALEQSLGLAPRPKGSPISGEPRVWKEKRKATDPFTLDPLDEQEQRLCSLYVQYVGDGASEDLRRKLRHRHLQLLLRHGYFDEAAEAAAAFVLDYPDDELGVSASEVLIEALVIQATVYEDDAAAWDRALEWTERLPTMPVWRHPEAEQLHEVVLRVRVGSLHHRALIARNADPPDYEACARDYDAALHDAALAPNVALPIDMLLLGAAQCLELAGDLAGAEARHEELRRRAPESVRDRP
jgi:hypothetical protein